jgi:hypothetical protein
LDISLREKTGKSGRRRSWNLLVIWPN